MAHHLKHSGRRSARVEDRLPAAGEHDPPASFDHKHAENDPHPIHGDHEIHQTHAEGSDTPLPHDPDQLIRPHHEDGDRMAGFHATEHSPDHTEDLHP